MVISLDTKGMLPELCFAARIPRSEAFIFAFNLCEAMPEKFICEVSFKCAAYNIGGHTISADTIQNTILRCRLPRPGQHYVAPPNFVIKIVDKDGAREYAWRESVKDVPLPSA
ncbi:hypothetical protein JHK82_024645 [Glycine max]|nr:hypothetical protein JHK85_025248 [Glycine max]KAG5012489.1 hypothetical protein JHK86_024750 [Glycine max]KAG5133457.1 hypothetical protein JHK82_024645 [Glycine max]